jgi:hypothetical protein
LSLPLVAQLPQQMANIKRRLENRFSVGGAIDSLCLLF